MKLLMMIPKMLPTGLQNWSTVKSLAVLAEDWGLIPSKHKAVQSCNSSPREADTLCDLWGHQARLWCTYIHVGKHSYTWNYYINLLKRLLIPSSCSDKFMFLRDGLKCAFLSYIPTFHCLELDEIIWIKIIVFMLMYFS